MKKYGFSYSSSVLPAKSPLFGWPKFGANFKLFDGIFEMPVTLHPFLKVPLAGGVYFRTLPFVFLSPFIKKIFKEGLPLQNYLHPYDIDIEQEKFMHPGINNNKFFNYLMYYNRNKVFQKLEKIIEMNVSLVTYQSYYTEMMKSNKNK